MNIKMFLEIVIEREFCTLYTTSSVLNRFTVDFICFFTTLTTFLIRITLIHKKDCNILKILIKKNQSIWILCKNTYKTKYFDSIYYYMEYLNTEGVLSLLGKKRE